VSRILFVDDEKYQSEWYFNAFRDSGHDVVRAWSVSEAARALSKERFDALVLDVMMDGADTAVGAEGGYLAGVEFARSLVEGGVTLPILFLTNSRDSKIDAWCSGHPAALVLRKSDIVPKEVSAALEKLIAAPDSRVDTIIFLHGLGGKASRTWGMFPYLVRASEEVGGLRVECFEYPTALFRLPLRRPLPRIQTLVDGLRTYLENQIGGHNVMLVCHSLGGVVARAYVLAEIKAGRGLRVKKLLLFAVPNNGASLADVGRSISRWNPQLRQLARDSDVIEQLNTDWQVLGVDHRVQTRFVVAGQDQVVDEASARMVWGNTVDVILNKGHRDVVKPKTDADMAFVILRRFVKA